MVDASSFLYMVLFHFFTVVPKPAARSTVVGKSRIVGKKPTGKAGSGLGVKKLTTKVDDSLYEQAPDEAPVQPVLPEADKDAPVAPTASRFAYDPEEEAKPVKKAVQRGKDGHLTLGGEGTDFFSNPMGDTSTRKNSGGYSPRYGCASIGVDGCDSNHTA